MSNHSVLSLCCHRKAPSSPLFTSGYLLHLTQVTIRINLKPALPEAHFGGQLQEAGHRMDRGIVEERTHTYTNCIGFAGEDSSVVVRHSKHPPRAGAPAAHRATLQPRYPALLHCLPERQRTCGVMPAISTEPLQRVPHLPQTWRLSRNGMVLEPLPFTGQFQEPPLTGRHPQTPSPQ